MLTFAAALIALSGIDLATMRLPRSLVYGTGAAGAVLLGVAAIAADEPHRIVTALAGAAIGFGVLGTVYLVAPRALGFGDVRLAGVVGLYCGWLGIAHTGLALFAAYLLGTVTTMTLIAIGRFDRHRAAPFGPFLAAGALVALLAGEPVVGAWLGT